MAGTNRCRLHGGASPQAMKKAKQRLLEAVDPLMKRLIDFAYDDTMPPAVQLKAIRDALDRAGFGAKQEILVEAKVTKWDELLDDTDDDAIVTFGDPVTDDELLDDEPAAVDPAPSRRALTPAKATPMDDEPLEGVVLDPPSSPGSGSMPPWLGRVLRDDGRLD